MTELCDIAYKYGTDKCPQIKHFYTVDYYEILKDRRESVKKVIELGIGHKDCMKHCKNYTRGASLYMWRDFFPNAQIYGADSEEKCLFQDDRIQTFICNQHSYRDLWRLLKKTGTDIDLFVDDGSHATSDQLLTCLFMMKRLKKDVIYIIEDVVESRAIMEFLPQYKGKLYQGKDIGHHDNRFLLITK